MLRAIFAQLMGVGAEELDEHKHFVELGADSLFLLQASQGIQSKFGIKLSFRVMLEEFSTLDLLAVHIDEQLPDGDSMQLDAQANVSQSVPDPTTPEPPLPESVPPPRLIAPDGQTAPATSAQERILSQQLQIMAQQVELLRHWSHLPAQPQTGGAIEKREKLADEKLADEKLADEKLADETTPSQIKSPPYVAYKPINREKTDSLSPRQREYIAELIVRCTEKTKGSKRIAATSRAALADNRATAGFRMLWKEIQYPLIADRAAGARLWDIDGNEYVDLAMGFGALLFGHSPSFIVSAMKEQLDHGLRLGAESEMAGKAAALICELTGVERATFCNSGTEAVMSALRLARTVTGRTRIALFEGCYHGTFDGVMVRAGRDADGNSGAVPLAPGVPEQMINDVLLLKLNDPASQVILRAQAHTLAAVLVEPMPSRFPDFRPEAFLGELRAITQKAGAALIFDEVITGFRFHPGGAQALFGVQADLVVYGKAAGGGLPISVVAGKSAYMDAIDGGPWSYGDDSYPRAETTFFAGTYFKHPLMMASVCAALEHMKQSGPELQERLNRRASEMADALNASFEEAAVPARVASFGSLIRFLFEPELKFSELFYYHLLEKGVYICETRSCFLSTAHTDQDIDFIVRAVRETIAEMSARGLLSSAREEHQSRALAPSQPKQVPLTDLQKDLWLLAQMGDDTSSAYNESVLLRLCGRLNLEVMRDAIREVVNRHEALRTTFDTEPTHQYIHATTSIDVPLTDLSCLQDEEREEQAREWCEREAHAVFDLVRGPVLRARIIKLSDELQLLILTIHGIATDGVSNGILVKEIASLYSAGCRGEVCSLAEPMPYSEYATQQAQLQSSDQMAEAETYWLAQFAGEFPILDLPTDRPRPALQTYAGARVQARLDQSALTALKRLSAQQNCTLFMALLAGYAGLLHRLTGQKEVVVNVPVAGQNMTGGKPLVGCCVSPVPFRSVVDERVTFEDFLNAAKKTWLDGYSRHFYPVNKLIKQLEIPRDPSRAFPISTLFNLDRFLELDVDGLEAETIISPAASAKFDLDLNITEADDGLLLCLEYNTDILDAETVSRWLNHLTVLLNAAAVDPKRRVLELPLLADHAAERLLVEWNDTTVDFPRETRLPRLFEQQVERKPDAVALVCGDEQLTYRELNGRANRMARYLKEVGVGTETVVGISVERSVEMVVDLLGVLKAGGAYLPLEKDFPAERLHNMLEESQVRVAIGRSEIAEKLGGRVETLILIDEVRGEIGRQRSENLDEENLDEENLDEEAEPLNAAYVAFTSGSTGRSKGVVGLHGGVLNRLFWMWRAYPFDEGEVCCQKTSLGFLDSLCEIFSPLLQGVPLAIIRDHETRDVASLLERLAENRVSRLVAVPSLLRAMLDLDQELGKHLPDLRLWVTSGEALSADLFERFKRQVPNGRLLNLYGMSEASADVTWADLSEDGQSGVTIGRPIANTRIYLLDGNMKPVPVGVNGEIYVGGVGLARGYLHRPELTAERFIPYPFSNEPGAILYRTGDLARWTRDGNIAFMGRLDNQVKIRGFRIEPGEVEAALNDHPGVKESIVVASQGDAGEKRLMAYVVSKEGRELSGSEVRKYLRERLPDYMVPSAVVVLDEMPMNASRKIDRQKLPEGKRGRDEQDSEYVTPLTPAERRLAEIWEEVLKVERVGVEDSFFELGGDSILAVQITINARQSGLHFTPKDIFEHRTIARLVERLEAIPKPRIEQGPVVGPVPLTPIQHWFFEQESNAPHHFNQANLLALARPIDPPILEKAVRELISHHDALRLRFVKEGEQWRQHNAAPEQTVPFTRVDLSAVPEMELNLAIEKRCAELQTSLDLTRGPIIQVAWFDLGAGRGSRLFIVIHHLAVDIASWGILLDDLTSACEQLSRGEAVSLPAKTTSFKEWAERLEDRARSEEMDKELAYWVSEKRTAAAANLPVDYADGENSTVSVETIILELGDEETRRLCEDTPRAYGTQVSELLLAALGEAIRRWSGAETVLVDVEGHGREETVFAGVDLTRTVGWFTNIYPVALEVGRSEEETIKQIKEEMRETSDRALGYGLLRYLASDDIVYRLGNIPQAQISFNFFSRFGNVTEKAAFREASHNLLGPSHHPDGRRRYLLEVTGILTEGRLQISWTYSERIHRRATIETLALHFKDALGSLTEHCVNRSKFYLANLDEQMLDRALEMVKF